MAAASTTDTGTADDLKDPDAETVGEALGVPARQVRMYVRNRENPTAAGLLGWFVADPDHHDLVDEYLEVVGE